MTAVAVTLTPCPHGWAVSLTDGRELACFAGPGARWRAMRYLTALTAELATTELAHGL